MNNNKNKLTVKLISIGGIFVGLAVIFQAAPVLLPVIGMSLSHLSTLPIALAGMLNISLGVTVYIASVIILAFISIEECLILLFTTGILGLVMGILIYRKGVLVSVLCSGVALSIGIGVLTYVIGVFQMGSLEDSIPAGVLILVFLLFYIVYAWVWNVMVRKFVGYLVGVKVFDEYL